MKIIKVIVDELPEDCGRCNFARQLLHEEDRFADFWYVCSAMGVLITDDEYIYQRPNWCPLVADIDVFEGEDK